MGTIRLFQDLNFELLVVIITSITINLITTISLFEKYRNVVKWLNISSILTIFFLIFKIIFWNVDYSKVIYIIIFYIIHIIIINVFKNKNFRNSDEMNTEIDQIGKTQ